MIAGPQPATGTASGDPGLRLTVNVTGLLLVGMAGLMSLPALVDTLGGAADAAGLWTAVAITLITGTLMVVASRGGLAAGRAADIRLAFLLTVVLWTVLPLFGTLPLMLGASRLDLTDALFEAVSGLTTTGFSVIALPENLPAGINLWRGLLNWAGGLGFALVAMIFLPVMRLGGMQFFRAQNFDTLGKVLPTAAGIARAVAGVYLLLTAAFVTSYLAAGLTPLEAIVHAMATISTGGFSSTSASFDAFRGLPEYLGALFMALSALPYVRYVQLLRGDARPILADPQVRMFLWILFGAVLTATLWLVIFEGRPPEQTFRTTLFNLTSVMTGTGFASGGFAGWEGPALAITFIVGFIGGCSGSSSGALSIYRAHLSFIVLSARIRQIQSPSRVIPIRYGGEAVTRDTVESLMMYVSAYIFGVGLLSVLVTLTGVDTYTAVIGVWSSLGNIGWGFGPGLMSGADLAALPDPAKWLLTLAMLLGRLGLLTILVLALPRFWLR